MRIANFALLPLGGALRGHLSVRSDGSNDGGQSAMMIKKTRPNTKINFTAQQKRPGDLDDPAMANFAQIIERAGSDSKLARSDEEEDMELKQAKEAVSVMWEDVGLNSQGQTLLASYLGETSVLKNVEGVTLLDKLTKHFSKHDYRDSILLLENKYWKSSVTAKEAELKRLMFGMLDDMPGTDPFILTGLDFQELGLVLDLKTGRLGRCFEGDWDKCTNESLKPLCLTEDEENCGTLNHVVLLIVVKEEADHLLTQLSTFSSFWKKDDDPVDVLGPYWNSIMKVADQKVSFTGVLGNMRITVVKFAETGAFGSSPKAYSGWTQSGALAYAVSLLNPSLVICYGTSGGYNQHSVLVREKDGDKILPLTDNDKIVPGDIVIASVSLFLDRIRFKNDRAFQWGMWGGASVRTDNMLAKGWPWLKRRVAGSQEAYPVEPLKRTVMDVLGGGPLDMEAASEAQIFRQMGVPYLALRIISNGVYPSAPEMNHAEYTLFKQNGTEKGSEKLLEILMWMSEGRAVHAL